MIKKTLLLALTFLTMLLFTSSCDTDVDVDAEWEEITIVYGLLNPLDTTHYFRINKAYLGGNAVEIAKIADSSSYQGVLEVILEGSFNNEPRQFVNFDTVTIGSKDTGDFYNPYMLVYQASAVLNAEYTYILKIKNTISGKEISANTNLVQDFAITKPPSGGKATFKRNFSTPFYWRNAVNGKRYEPILRFHYYEIPAGTFDTVSRYVDWAQPTMFADDISGYGTQETELNNNGFYDFIDNSVKPEEYNGKRLCGIVEFIVSAGGEEYDTFLRVNGPSYSLVQDRPEYTNIENGYGLLSSRYRVVKSRRLSPLAEDEILLLGLGFSTNPEL